MRNLKLKKGFTMIELIFVIIVLGILAAASISQLRLNVRENLINNVLTSLRYTQHLALTDNKMVPSNNLWMRSLWTFKNEQCNGDWQYTIGSDTSLDGDFQVNEAATSVIDQKLLFSDDTDCDSGNTSESIALGRKFDVASVTFNGCGNSNAVSFDYLGRPHIDTETINNSNYNSLLKNNCIITYTFNSAIFTISRDTGYITVNNRARL